MVKLLKIPQVSSPNKQQNMYFAPKILNTLVKVFPLQSTLKEKTKTILQVGAKHCSLGISDVDLLILSTGKS